MTFFDILLCVDSGSCASLVPLDLRTAFDMIDYNIPLKLLKDKVGLQGQAVDWFTSYWKDRTFSVELGDHSSSTAPITCGVPQGSSLGLLLFSLYVLP